MKNELRLRLRELLLGNPVTGPAVKGWLGRPRRLDIDGVSFVISDQSGSSILSSLVREFWQDDYGLRTISFSPGDVVIDIGAHVGIESVYLAKRYPFLKILAFEPVPQNYLSLQANLSANSITNVQAFPLAVTGDGRDLDIWVDFGDNSAGGGHDRPAEYFAGRQVVRTGSVTLDQIIEENGIERCRLLKIDCEGAEHEILRSSRHLDRMDFLSGEFHVDEYLRNQGHSIGGLIDHCAQFIRRDNIRIVEYTGGAGTADQHVDSQESPRLVEEVPIGVADE